MNLLESTKNKITKDKCTASWNYRSSVSLSKYCQQWLSARVLYTFVPNKPFDSLLEISPKNNIFLRILNAEFQAIEVWFTDQQSQPSEIEDIISFTLVIE